MNLNQYTQHDPVLRNLLRQANYMKELDKKIKLLFPLNLSDYFQAVCIQENGQLILLVKHATAASRLKMLLPAVLPKIQELDDRINQIALNIQPISQPKKPPKQCVMNEEILTVLEQSLPLFEHSPKLTETLLTIIKNHQSN